MQVRTSIKAGKLAINHNAVRVVARKRRAS
jgi:hypothetical protein